MPFMSAMAGHAIHAIACAKVSFVNPEYETCACRRCTCLSQDLLLGEGSSTGSQSADLPEHDRCSPGSIHNHAYLCLTTRNELTFVIFTGRHCRLYGQIIESTGDIAAWHHRNRGKGKDKGLVINYLEDGVTKIDHPVRNHSIVPTVIVRPNSPVASNMKALQSQTVSNFSRRPHCCTLQPQNVTQLHDTLAQLILESMK